MCRCSWIEGAAGMGGEEDADGEQRRRWAGDREVVGGRQRGGGRETERCGREGGRVWARGREGVGCCVMQPKEEKEAGSRMLCNAAKAREGGRKRDVV